MGAALLAEKRYRAQGMEFGNETVGSLLAQRDEAGFEQLFKTHFKRLHAYAVTLLQNEAEAEETVQQVFFKLWERRENLSADAPVTAYLYRAVHNESLNYLKHQQVKSRHQLQVAYRMKNEAQQPGDKSVSAELEKKIHAALQELPEQCRTIFQLSRFEELKYREIADRLDLSVKTVENQMGKALKILRAKLAEFLVYILLFIKLLIP